MSKLDGNERWGSKMLLTEHQEQYDAERSGPAAVGEPTRPAGHPTTEEMVMIRDVILLPHMLTMAQRSIDDSKLSGNFMSQLHIAATQAIMDMISKDLYALRRELSQRRIRIVADEQVDLVIYHRYICRGYEERFGIVREVMRAEISVKFSGYISKIKTIMRSGHDGNKKTGEEI
ncbi:hypothetical protein [Cohnella sp. JJ-181]|uniref:hypothetical protein n=1 Tax=Cohnella rhizoplanae TaxID=2974897 RepID=UPI0022FF8683|nr:hypothetical protein [Cohnella sp. JJ-181]CAI6086728.1 hypothetical protein COHCIP112018_05148 [Cohnella sp. JJ-181]